MTPNPSLAAEDFWAILNGEMSDAHVNELLWHTLGYRRDPQSQGWSCDQVPADWAEAYPTPPDFLGSRAAIVKLTRSIPKEDKQLLKTQLGFSGYTLDQLTPQRTRRATAVNWLLSVQRRQSQSAV